MNDHSDQQFDDDEKISALYRAGSTAQPPEHIDQAIRAKARRSVSSTPRRALSPWTVPVSMAAILVLSVSLISLIHEEAPTISDIRSDIPASRAEKIEMAENDNKEKPADTPERLSDQASVTETMGLVQPGPEQKTKRQNEKADKPSPTLQKSRASAKIKEKLTSGVTMEISDEISQESLQQAIPQTKNQPLELRSGNASTEFSVKFKKDFGDKVGKNCEQSSHSACLDSAECSLVMNNQKALVCNRSINHCDDGFVQRSGTKESCEAKQGCVYVSRPCVCPPDVVCTCDNGQFSQCQIQKKHSM